MTLERIEHKIFASEAPLDEVGQFGSALATTKFNTKDVAEIQALPAYTKGWGSAIISENNYPPMEEMNGVLNVMSYHTGYLYQEGIPTYSATQEYSATSWVKDLAGEKIYKSLQNENVGHSLTDTSWWQEVFGNSVYVKKSGDTMTGDLTLTRPDTYWRTLRFNALGEAGVIPTSTVCGGRFVSFDNKDEWWATVQQSLDKDGASNIYLAARNTADGVTYKNHTLSIKSYPNGSGGTYIDGKLVTAHITETYRNGASWYRVYSDKWCEQGGITSGTVTDNFQKITFLKSFANLNYTVTYELDGATGYYPSYIGSRNRTKTSVEIVSRSANVVQKYPLHWTACGYIS